MKRTLVECTSQTKYHNGRSEIFGSVTALDTMKRVIKAKPRNCAKCGSSPAGDPSVKLHRFPQPNKVNKPRCELWAKFCFPNNAWKSPKFQSKLYREHKMLCDKHFKSTSIEKEKKLRRSSRLEKNHDMIQENFADVIVEIKNEPDEDITNMDYSSEATSPQQKRTEANIATSNSPSKTNSQIIKEGLEESAEIDNSLKSTVKDMWHVELPEMSQEDFDETYNDWFSQTSKSDRNDDSQLYGKLITKKLRTYSVHERNLLMYKIDGLLIEHPPGFNTSSESILTKPDQLTAVIKKQTKAKQSTKNKASTLSTIEESQLTNSDKSSPKLQRKRVTKESLPQEDEMRSIYNEEPYTISTQVTSTSMPCFSPLQIPVDLPPPAVTSSILKQSVMATHIPNEPVKVTSSPAKGKSSIQYQPIKVTSSIQNPPVKVTSSIPNKPVKVTSSIPNKPVNITSSIPNKPVNVTSSIPNKPVKVTSSIPNKPVVSISSQSPLQPLSTSVPSHLPLKITIPETKFIPITQNKVSHPKGKIVIMKSKSSKYVPSSQPPILITVPTLPTVGHFPISTKCDMNSLEQLSSIAVTRASQAHQYHTRLETKEVEMVDDNNMDVVSHEVILSASSNSPSQNIVETALKNARIEDEHN